MHKQSNYQFPPRIGAKDIERENTDEGRINNHDNTRQPSQKFFCHIFQSISLL